MRKHVQMPGDPYGEPDYRKEFYSTKSALEILQKRYDAREVKLKQFGALLNELFGMAFDVSE